MQTIKMNNNSYRKNIKAVIVLLLPALLIYLAFEVLPIIQSFYFAFFQWNGMVTVPLKFVGFNNFFDLAKNSYFPLALKNTLWFMILSTIVQLSVAFLLALALATYCKGYKFFKATFFIPLVLSLTGVSLMWYFILFPGSGPLSSLLTGIGLDGWNRQWLADKGTAINSIILVNSWVSIGFYMVVLFSALTTISQDILESAEIDGSLGLHSIFMIKIPLIWDVIKVAIVMEITGNLKIFEIVFIMTRGGPDGLTNTLGTLLYNEAFQYFHFGTGSVISIIIFALSITITIFSLKVMQRETL